MCFLQNIFTITRFRKSSIFTWEKYRHQITFENKAAVSANELVIFSLTAKQAWVLHESTMHSLLKKTDVAITEQLQLDFWIP